MNLRSWKRIGSVAAVGFLAVLVVVGTLISSFQWINKPFPGFLLYGNRSVAPDFLPNWTGRREGLGFLDRIVAVNGEPIRDPRALYASVRTHPSGTLFRYTLERGGKTHLVEIRSMKFSFHDWLLSFGLYLFAGLGFLAIGFTPFYLRSPSPASLPLFFMVTAIFVWFATTFDFMTTQLLPREVRVFAFTLTPTIGIHLGLRLAGRDGRGVRRFCLLLYGVSILLGLFYSYSFDGPPELWHWALRLAYGYSCLAALIFLAVLWVALRKPLSELERSRLRVVLVGAALGFFLPTFGTVLTSFFVWEIPYNFLVVPAAFFPLSVAYALLKYNLFDLSNVLKVGLTRSALTGVLLLIYVVVVSLLSVSIGVYEKDPLVPLFFSLLVVVIFNPLLRWIEGFVDRAFYFTEYDANQLQSEVSLLLRSLSRPEAIGQKSLRLLTDRVGIENALLLFRATEQERFAGISAEGKTGGFEEIGQELSSVWVRYLGIAKKGISRDEAKTDPAYHDCRESLWRIFAGLNSELLIVLTFEEDILGFISLGRKRSGRGYSAEDFRFLCHLADQLVLALENGMLFEESEQAKENYRLLYDKSQAMNQRLIEVDRLKKDFVANISHELRTPISTILGYTEVLLDPAFGGDRRGILERVVTSGQDLSELMDSLFDFSRMETGAFATGLQKVDVSEIFRSLDVMTRRLIRERPIRFRLQTDLPVEVLETDPNKLRQILAQLLTNALKFTESGEIALEMRSLSDEGGSLVEISVSDTGIGISKEHREIIFDEFRQLDGSSTRQYGGTGLGLSLCRKLAHSLGGRIAVESEVGRGSTFSLILPLRRLHPEAGLALLAS